MSLVRIKAEENEKINYVDVREKSPFKRQKIKGDIRRLLRKEGFKRSFFRYPRSEVYVKGDLKAYINSGKQVGVDQIGKVLIPHSGEYNYERVRVDVVGIESPRFEKVVGELSNYSKSYYKRQKEETEAKKRRKEERGGLEEEAEEPLDFADDWQDDSTWEFDDEYIFIFFMMGGIALSIFSFQSTGNVIGSATQTAHGLIGIFLFVLGIVGFFFTRKK